MCEALFSQQLRAIQKQNAYRTRQALGGPQGVNITIDDKQLISFCSNDYLGLANDPRVCDAAINAIREYGIGTGASQFISGYSSLHAQLEQQLAEFFDYPRCVLFSSGYLANLGVVSTFANHYSYVLQDKLNHASIIDAAKFAGATLKRYRHRDVQHATKIMHTQKNAPCMIITDGVFSMEGSIAPLELLVQLRQNTENMIIVDDAHGIGTIGQHGKGSIEQEKLSSSDIDVLIGTLGKSFGVSGAFVLGSHEAIELLIQQARTLIYTTAAPASLAAAASCSLDIIINEPQRRWRLKSNIEYFRHCCHQTSLDLLDSTCAIQSLVIGDNDKSLKYSHKLKQLGFLVMAIRPPTVPKNTARLRITLCSEHTHNQIDQLISALIEIMHHPNQD